MKIGDRVEYIGPYEPWRGHTGVIWESAQPFEHRKEEIFKVGWDDPPERLPSAFITNYNRKQWRVLDDPRSNDREIHPATQPSGSDQAAS